jgi:hypothetical protein
MEITQNNFPLNGNGLDYRATFGNWTVGDKIGFGATPELAEEALFESIRCGICGDFHKPGTIPYSCETGDGV